MSKLHEDFLRFDEIISRISQGTLNRWAKQLATLVKKGGEGE
mgnify:CR=1 FL=1|tara:strand:- start:2483 stop:2608 length:126 start_codon:yes stop_codon:yes gene_type:complete